MNRSRLVNGLLSQMQHGYENANCNIDYIERARKIIPYVISTYISNIAMYSEKRERAKEKVSRATSLIITIITFRTLAGSIEPRRRVRPPVQPTHLLLELLHAREVATPASAVLVEQVRQEVLLLVRQPVK